MNLQFLTTFPIPAAPGPHFTEADFKRALAQLDIALQNYAWAPGENHLDADSVLRSLTARNITQALAIELLRHLFDQQVFR